MALGKSYDHSPVKSNGDSLPDGMPTLYTMLRDAGYRVGSTGKLDLRKPQHDWGPDGQHRVNGKVYFNEWGFTDGLDSEGKGDSFSGIKTDPTTGQPRGESPYTKLLTDRQDGSLERYIAWKDAQSQAPRPGSYTHTTPIELADDAYNDNWVGQNALALIESFPKEQPWFLQVNFPGPHAPMDITPPMDAWYRDTVFPQPFENTQIEAAMHVAIRRNYSAMVENIDRWLGRYLDVIDARGERNNTLVVFSSDHGEMLGDHDRWSKSVPYQPSAAVPLVIAGPGVGEGARNAAPVETNDLTSTFLDYAGVAIPSDMTSRSLRPMLDGSESVGRPAIFSGLNEWRAVFDGRYKLVRGYNTDDPDPKATTSRRTASSSTMNPDHAQLFDLMDDPMESINLADSLPDHVRRLSELMMLRIA
ncbi:MAG: hypothetical protein AMXMBFR84_34440 [Candidatus Hydrogenedentota bacterium]